MPEMDRRKFLGLSLLGPLAAAAAGAAVPAAWAAPAGLELGPPRPFDFDRLRREARRLAERPFKPDAPAAGGVIRTIDFDLTQKIRFRAEDALWPDGPGPFPVRFFHLNKFVDRPVDIFAVADGQARRIVYSPRYFDYGGTGLGSKLPADLGFAGFRLMSGRGLPTDWLAFLGASYFRSSGDENQYGASARGIAIDSGMAIPEEFPRFTRFWLEAPKDDARTVVIHALLEGRSLTGAYRFTATRAAGAVIDVHAELFFRRAVRRLGLAPLTSMFWYAENGRNGATDWRPEIHDSDGLALWTGAGERIWRPLVDPPSVQTNSFFDTDPRGFGLMQRDRDFDHYQDDGAFYNRRPSIWIEPRGAWGKGAVVLVEIPTDDEIHDNIVAFWQPAQDVARGTTMSLDYRMTWQADEPHPPSNVGRVVATRIGHGGVPGHSRPPHTRKFVIDFEGGPLDALKQRFDVTPVITAPHGKVVNPYVVKVVGTRRWRAVFDLALADGGPVNLRCFLRLDGKTLTETWLYQYHPGGE